MTPKHDANPCYIQSDETLPSASATQWGCVLIAMHIRREGRMRDFEDECGLANVHQLSSDNAHS